MKYEGIQYPDLFGHVASLVAPTEYIIYHDESYVSNGASRGLSLFSR